MEYKDNQDFKKIIGGMINWDMFEMEQEEQRQKVNRRHTMIPKSSSKNNDLRNCPELTKVNSDSKMKQNQETFQTKKIDADKKLHDKFANKVTEKKDKECNIESKAGLENLKRKAEALGKTKKPFDDRKFFIDVNNEAGESQFDVYKRVIEVLGGKAYCHKNRGFCDILIWLRGTVKYLDDFKSKNKPAVYPEWQDDCIQQRKFVDPLQHKYEIDSVDKKMFDKYLGAIQGFGKKKKVSRKAGTDSGDDKDQSPVKKKKRVLKKVKPKKSENKLEDNVEEIMVIYEAVQGKRERAKYERQIGIVRTDVDDLSKMNKDQEKKRETDNGKVQKKVTDFFGGGYKKDGDIGDYDDNFDDFDEFLENIEKDIAKLEESDKNRRQSRQARASKDNKMIEEEVEVPAEETKKNIEMIVEADSEDDDGDGSEGDGDDEDEDSYNDESEFNKKSNEVVGAGMSKKLLQVIEEDGEDDENDKENINCQGQVGLGLKINHGKFMATISLKSTKSHQSNSNLDNQKNLLKEKVMNDQKDDDSYEEDQDDDEENGHNQNQEDSEKSESEKKLLKKPTDPKLESIPTTPTKIQDQQSPKKTLAASDAKKRKSPASPKKPSSPSLHNTNKSHHSSEKTPQTILDLGWASQDKTDFKKFIDFKNRCKLTFTSKYNFIGDFHKGHFDFFDAYNHDIPVSCTTSVSNLNFGQTNGFKKHENLLLIIDEHVEVLDQAISPLTYLILTNILSFINKGQSNLIAKDWINHNEVTLSGRKTKPVQHQKFLWDMEWLQNTQQLQVFANIKFFIDDKSQTIGKNSDEIEIKRELLSGVITAFGGKIVEKRIDAVYKVDLSHNFNNGKNTGHKDFLAAQFPLSIIDAKDILDKILLTKSDLTTTYDTNKLKAKIPTQPLAKNKVTADDKPVPQKRGKADGNLKPKPPQQNNNSQRSYYNTRNNQK